MALIQSETLSQQEFCQAPERVLVLGNGFDLSLGLHTTYRDFATSKFWPFANRTAYPNHTLAATLHNANNLEKWFDMEEVMFRYSSANNITYTVPSHQIIPSLTDFDKQSFYIVSKALRDYLKNEERNGQIDKGGFASIFLETFLNNNSSYRIYSFNYTNFNLLANRIGNIKYKFECDYIHGSVEDDIILGVGDKRKLRNSYFFLHKSAHPKFKSNSLVTNLHFAKDVYIFGHSLGENDHDYFRDFFEESARYYDSVTGERRKITIFTYDEASKLEIKRQLMTLTQSSLISLYAHCDVKIVCTSSNDSLQYLCDMNDIRR